MKYSDEEIEEQKEFLRSVVKPGDTIYCILRHCSRSGMTRHIGLVIMTKDGHPIHPNYAASVLLGESIKHGYDGVKMEGCGMDMGFHLVYTLGMILYPDGFECTGERCPSNEHLNGDHDRTPHMHKSGGYALRSEWL